MNAGRSVVLGQSYFIYPNYLLVHFWILATLLDPTIITLVVVLNVWGHILIFVGGG